MYKLPCHINKERDSEERIEHTSNRAEMISNIICETNSRNIHISEIMIQNQEMTFNRSSARPISYMNYEGYMQLNFYSKEYLDKRPVHKSSSSMMFFKSDKELGSNGFKSRICMIKSVDKDFNGSIDVELFSRYMEIPEEIITVL